MANDELQRWARFAEARGVRAGGADPLPSCWKVRMDRYKA